MDTKREIGHIWKYVRAIINALYEKFGGDGYEEYRKLISSKRDRNLEAIDYAFLERIWRNIPIEKFIDNFLSGSRYIGIGILFSRKRVNECESLYRFHLCRRNEDCTDIVVDDCSMTNYGVGSLDGDHLVQIHRKIFDLFAHLVDQDLLKEKIRMMKCYLSEDRRLPFNSESQSDIG